MSLGVVLWSLSPLAAHQSLLLPPVVRHKYDRSIRNGGYPPERSVHPLGVLTGYFTSASAVPAQLSHADAPLPLVCVLRPLMAGLAMSQFDHSCGRRCVSPRVCVSSLRSLVCESLHTAAAGWYRSVCCVRIQRALSSFLSVPDSLPLV